MRQLISKWNTLGLQLRTMIYVSIGLVLLFAVIAFFGLRTVAANTQEVFEERTALAQSLASEWRSL
jgi:type VI protein secretion system component VasF